MLAERFHASPALLRRLNPRLTIEAGVELMVPNVDVVSAAESKPLLDIVVRVSKQASSLTVTDSAGNVIMHAPVTSGSEHDPLPIDMWTVTGVARHPRFNDNPDLFWDAEPSQAPAESSPWRAAMSGPPRMVPARAPVGEDHVEALREPVATPRDASAPARPAPAPAPPPDAVAPPTIGADPIEDLRKRHLALPVEGLKRDSLRDTFDEQRGPARHEALDILAPRDTPVVAVEDGTIAKLFLSKPGGSTIYQFDPDGTYAYYHAHLARYADGLKEGMPLERGQTIGYVGTTGNAPLETPHLRFAIFKLTDQKRWWKGTAIDPYPILR